MNQLIRRGRQVTHEDARSALIRVGLSVSDERLDRIVPGLQFARIAAAALAALELGYRGPASFQAPAPAEAQRTHGN